MPRLREFRWEAWAEWTAATILQDAPDVVAIDTETTGVGFYDVAFTTTLTWRGRDGSLKSGYIELPAEGALPVAGAAVTSPLPTERNVDLLRSILDTVDVWVYHNSKFDLQKLILAGATTLGRVLEVELHDTQTIYTLINENDRKGLKYLAAKVLGIEDVIEVEIKSGPNKGQTKREPREAYRLAAVRRKLKLKKEDGYHLLPREVLIPYALKDTEFTLMLFEILLPRLVAVGDPRLLELYREFMELKVVLLDMEADGFALDMPYLDEVTSEYGVKVMEGWDGIVTLTDNPELNPQSPAQILAAFAKRGVRLDSTAEATLKEVKDDLAAALLQYRSDKKIHATYLTSLRAEQRGGLVHPNFNDDAARTGRMSSSAASNN